MKYKAIIFDLDGTLLDTIDDLADSMNYVLNYSGFPVHDREAYKYFVGDGIRNLVIRALPEYARHDQEIEHCFKAMKDEYDQRWSNKTRAYDGIPELLDSISGKGIKLAVLSNKADKFTKLIISKLLSKWNFDVVLGHRDGTPLKPDPSGAYEIIDFLGIPAKEFIYLGDTSVDMQTAKAAGMYAVGVLWGFREAGELLASGADMLISKPNELIELL